jgi:hypothetical protein
MKTDPDQQNNAQQNRQLKDLALTVRERAVYKMPGRPPVAGDNGEFAEVRDDRKMLLIVTAPDQSPCEQQVRHKSGDKLREPEQDPGSQFFNRFRPKLEHAKFNYEEDEKGINACLIKSEAREDEKGAYKPGP